MRPLVAAMASVNRKRAVTPAHQIVGLARVPAVSTMEAQAALIQKLWIAFVRRTPRAVIRLGTSSVRQLRTFAEVVTGHVVMRMEPLVVPLRKPRCAFVSKIQTVALCPGMKAAPSSPRKSVWDVAVMACVGMVRTAGTVGLTVLAKGIRNVRTDNAPPIVETEFARDSQGRTVWSVRLIAALARVHAVSRILRKGVTT